VTAQHVAVAIVDLHLPDMLGYEVIRRLHEIQPSVECVILTGEGTERGADAARLAGAADYFEKPIVDHPRFFQVIRRACEVHHLRRTVDLLGPPEAEPRLIGQSAAMVRLRQLIDRVAGASAPVLITGESGVGKEVVAEALHEQGRRRGEFVRINCAALPESLIESELFGAEEGTFTGQKGRREGLFAIADGGTLFLDEIGEMPLGLQPKLLRVLQSGQFRPLGARTERHLSARVIAATNIDLRDAIAHGRFREDLFFRLAVLEVNVPPLRARPDDIPILASHFGRKYAASEGRSGVAIEAAAMDALVAYAWPGNVRELSNAMMRSIILQRGAALTVEDLNLPHDVRPPTPILNEVRRAAPSQPASGWDEWFELPLSQAKNDAVTAFTRSYLEAKLRKTHGNVTQAALQSGMQRPNFKREMRKFGVLAGADDDQPDGD
jgi:two-component system response regulator HydG